MMGNRLPDMYQAPYIVGIGGVGMAGLARMLLELGRPVAGSDLRASEITRSLEAEGVAVEIGEPSHEMLQRASCVITPVSMGYASKIWIYCMTHQILVCNKVQALSDVIASSVREPVYVLGATSRGKVARMIANAVRIGWLCGLVPVRGDDRLAHFDRRMAVELDDPYILRTPKSLERFPDGDFVISDFQFEDYDHYGRGRTDIRELVDRIRREKSLSGRCLVLPRPSEAAGELPLRIVMDDDFDHAEECMFKFDGDHVYAPSSWGISPMRYAGTRADASGLAAACAYLHARGCAELPLDVPAVGWFEAVSPNEVLEIRMHPYHVFLALESASKCARGRKVHAVFKPFISVFGQHAGAYWCRAFRMSDEVHIVVPGYEGVGRDQIDEFVTELREGLSRPVCMDALEDIRAFSESAEGRGDFWVWIGAPDLVGGMG